MSNETKSVKEVLENIIDNGWIPITNDDSEIAEFKRKYLNKEHGGILNGDNCLWHVQTGIRFQKKRDHPTSIKGYKETPDGEIILLYPEETESQQTESDVKVGDLCRNLRSDCGYRRLGQIVEVLQIEDHEIYFTSTKYISRTSLSKSLFTKYYQRVEHPDFEENDILEKVEDSDDIGVDHYVHYTGKNWSQFRSGKYEKLTSVEFSKDCGHGIDRHDKFFTGDDMSYLYRKSFERDPDNGYTVEAYRLIKNGVQSKMISETKQSNEIVDDAGVSDEVVAPEGMKLVSKEDLQVGDMIDYVGENWTASGGRKCIVTEIDRDLGDIESKLDGDITVDDSHNYYDITNRRDGWGLAAYRSIETASEDGQQFTTESFKFDDPTLLRNRVKVGDRIQFTGLSWHLDEVLNKVATITKIKLSENDPDDDQFENDIHCYLEGYKTRENDPYGVTRLEPLREDELVRVIDYDDIRIGDVVKYVGEGWSSRYSGKLAPVTAIELDREGKTEYDTIHSSPKGGSKGSMYRRSFSKSNWKYAVELYRDKTIVDAETVVDAETTSDVEDEASFAELKVGDKIRYVGHGWHGYFKNVVKTITRIEKQNDKETKYWVGSSFFGEGLLDPKSPHHVMKIDDDDSDPMISNKVNEPVTTIEPVEERRVIIDQEGDYVTHNRHFVTITSVDENTGIAIGDGRTYMSNCSHDGMSDRKFNIYSGDLLGLDGNPRGSGSKAFTIVRKICNDDVEMKIGEIYEARVADSGHAVQRNGTHIKVTKQLSNSFGQGIIGDILKPNGKIERSKHMFSTNISDPKANGVRFTDGDEMIELFKPSTKTDADFIGKSTTSLMTGVDDYGNPTMTYVDEDGKTTVIPMDQLRGETSDMVWIDDYAGYPFGATGPDESQIVSDESQTNNEGSSGMLPEIAAILHDPKTTIIKVMRHEDMKKSLAIVHKNNMKIDGNADMLLLDDYSVNDFIRELSDNEIAELTKIPDLHVIQVINIDDSTARVKKHENRLAKIQSKLVGSKPTTSDLLKNAGYSPINRNVSIKRWLHVPVLITAIGYVILSFGSS